MNTKKKRDAGPSAPDMRVERLRGAASNLPKGDSVPLHFPSDMPGQLQSEGQNAVSTGKIPKFGYAELAARVASEISSQAGGDGAGRRQVLRALALHFETGEAVLLRRGFDKAYRMAVEGL